MSGKDFKQTYMLREYECPYPNCGMNFQKPVRNSNPTDGKHNSISTQVQCPKCKNFLKTWGCGKDVHEVVITR